MARDGGWLPGQSAILAASRPKGRGRAHRGRRFGGPPNQSFGVFLRMPSRYVHVVRDLSAPLEPEPTGESPVLTRLEGVRAVLFDVYGTLFISGSGEVGTTGETVCQEAFSQAFESLGMRLEAPAGEGVQLYFQAIENSHAESRRHGIEHPEVDVIGIWREVVARLSGSAGSAPASWTDERLERLAIEYECRANPVWPMPGLRECLAALARRGLSLGIVSNAQFYTPLLFAALLGATPEQLGFDPTLEHYSYQYGQAKPGLTLHRRAADSLAQHEIKPSEALYVGNDMLNDIYPAGRLGFRTALFAGDARSLRRREGDPRVDGVMVDLVLTSLAQLNDCVE